MLGMLDRTRGIADGGEWKVIRTFQNASSAVAVARLSRLTLTSYL
jgi:hypothetical protein